MAEFNIHGRMKVSTLKSQFSEAFGASLRIYKGKHFADDDATLASIRVGDEVEKDGEFECRGNMKVETFEAKIKEIFGITVQVATADNSKLANNSDTLTEVSR